MENKIFAEFKCPHGLAAHFPDDAPVLRHARDILGDKHKRLVYFMTTDQNNDPVVALEAGHIYRVWFAIPNGVPFKWVKDSVRVQGPHKGYVQHALYLCGLSFLDEEDYYIAKRPGERSIQYTNDGWLLQGEEYYLCLI